MGSKTSVEIDSDAGVVKINNLTNHRLLLVFTSVEARIVRRATSQNVHVGVGEGGAVSFGYSSSDDTSFLISVVYSAEILINRPSRTYKGWDNGDGVTRYEGAMPKGTRFYLSLFVDGTLRLLNKVFHGGNVISFHRDGSITYRPQMKFDGKNEHRSCGNWSHEVSVQLVEEAPPYFRPLNTTK